MRIGIAGFSQRRKVQDRRSRRETALHCPRVFPAVGPGCKAEIVSVSVRAAFATDRM